MHASVVIPNLNSPLIDQVLAALRAQTLPPLEVLVVGLDRPGLVHEDSLVRLIDTGKPASPARARNLGARLARGEVICYTDADCIARPDWIERLLAHHREGAVVVGGGVAVERDDYWRLCDNVAAFLPFLEDAPPGPRRYLPSLNFSIRRALLLAHEGFDERFPLAAGEDTDLGLRLLRAGHTLWFEPRAAVIHRHLRSSPAALWRHLYTFGRTYVDIRPRYTDVLGHWRRIVLAERMPRLLPVAGPALAVADLVERLVRHPHLWAYRSTFPALVLAQIAWYYGAAEGLTQQLSQGRAREGPPSLKPPPTLPS